MRLLGLVSFGALAGVLAGAAQLGLLRYGAIDSGQLPLLLGAFVAAGVALTLAGDAAGGLVARRPSGFTGVALVTPILAFSIGVPLNLRDLPHVFLLVSDTTRADHLSIYGYERATTPTLEKLAEHAVVFENSVSQGSHTIVSTPSILTSVYPSEHGMSRYSEVLPEKLTLLSESLQAAGYRTYGYATNPHLSAELGFSQGFDAYVQDAVWGASTASGVNRRFLTWLDVQDRQQPIFAFLFYVDPHSPYAPPESYRARFDPDWSGEPLALWDADWGQPAADSDRLVNLVAQYDAEIAYWDAELANLVRALKRRDAYEDALLVYTSDHGEEFFDHGNWGHNRTLFEESIRVPLVISVPVPIHLPRLARPARVVREVASGVDVLPTVLDYLGIDPPGRARGRSLVPLLLGQEEEGPERIAYSEEILDSYGPYDVRAVRTRDLKYVRILDYEGDRTQRDFLFDLRADPAEQVNLRERDPERAETLERKLDAMLAEMARAEPPGNESVELDPAGIERLEALGYVGNEGVGNEEPAPVSR